MSFKIENSRTVQVKLEKINDIKDFVDIVKQYDFNITLSSGEYVVDAKSIIEIFSLDLNENIKLTANTTEQTDLFNKIEKYII